MKTSPLAEETILHVLQGTYPAEGGGGAEFQVATLTRYFRSRGMPTHVLVPMVSWRTQVDFEVIDGVPVSRLKYPLVRVLGGAVMHLRLVYWLVRNRSKYGYIHAHIAGTMSAVCAVVGKALGKPVLVKLTGLHELDKGILSHTANSPVQAMMRWCFRRATWMQAISERIRARLLEFGFDPARVRTLPNAVDTSRFFSDTARRQAARERLQLAPGDVVAVYSGRFETEKGVEALLLAWGRVLARRREFKLVMMGMGNLEARMAEIISEFSMAGQVMLLGPVGKVEDYLPAADFCVLPSHNEGLSNALLEAMACGLPVLGSRVSGTEDFVIPGETGDLFEPRDLSSLENALRRYSALDQGEIRRQGQTALELVRRRASIGQVARTLSELYGGRVLQDDDVKVAG